MGYIDWKKVKEAAERQGIPIEEVKKGKYYVELPFYRLRPNVYRLTEKHIKLSDDVKHTAQEAHDALYKLQNKLRQHGLNEEAEVVYKLGETLHILMKKLNILY